jgi:hypothetical protein
MIKTISLQLHCHWPDELQESAPQLSISSHFYARLSQTYAEYPRNLAE